MKKYTSKIGNLVNLWYNSLYQNWERLYDGIY